MTGQGTLSKLGDDTKLQEVAVTLESGDAIQKDLNRQQKWADRNLMDFIKSKYKLLHLGCDNPVPLYKLGPAVCKKLFRKGPHSGQVKHESAVCPCSKGGQPHLGLHE